MQHVPSIWKEEDVGLKPTGQGKTTQQGTVQGAVPEANKEPEKDTKDVQGQGRDHHADHGKEGAHE